MPSSLTWIDHDAAARERSLRILALFNEKESRDELGIGAIRDAIADRLFPGTSTIQTRLKYMLLIPWMYQELEKQRIPASQFAGRARQAELAMVRPLLDLREAGVFGRTAGSDLKRLPSSVYWSGLGVWGIRRFDGSQQDYHRAVDRLYAMRARRVPSADERRDPDDHHPDVKSQSWHPRLPVAPPGFPASANLRITRDEAGFFIDRITATARDSLLGWLVLHGRPADVQEPWLHPQIHDFPGDTRTLLRHGRLFADVVEGAARIYNLMLGEKSGRQEVVGQHRDALDSWRSRIDLAGLHSWSLDEFWHQTSGTSHTVTPATRQFVSTWVNRVLAREGVVADDAIGRALVQRREMDLKRVRSRFINQGALTQWGGNAGTGRLNYRWSNVRTLLADLFAGLEES